MYTQCIKAISPSPYNFIHMKKEITYDVLIMHKSLTLVASTTTQSYIDLQHVAILQTRNTMYFTG